MAGFTAAGLDRARIVVEGEVQGVGYRYFVRRVARRHGLKGYVANLTDGAVEVVVEGERRVIEGFVKQINVTKPPISVAEVSVEYHPPTGEFKAFTIKTGSLEEEMVEGFSTGAAYFEVMFAKQDQMLAKQDQMLAKQDQMLEKQDAMLAKQDELVKELREFRLDFREYMNRRFEKLEREIALIKEKIGLA